MDASNIMIFAGLALEKRATIDAIAVQKYIINNPSVMVAVPLEKIEDALGKLVTAGFLEVVEGDSCGSTYKRYVPERKKGLTN